MISAKSYEAETRILVRRLIGSPDLTGPRKIKILEAMDMIIMTAIFALGEEVYEDGP
ncbi:unnamed protein product [marine sediment metagenome]|uniref:Uncharacterized protein n=1 Tax=marine sediment metagenome TaxID=412755 RepID=X1JZD1_9ZZZZ